MASLLSSMCIRNRGYVETVHHIIISYSSFRLRDIIRLLDVLQPILIEESRIGCIFIDEMNTCEEDERTRLNLFMTTLIQ